MAALKKNGNGTKINKSAFVRSFPGDTPAKEVVDAGKSKGIKLTIAYVYSIRANAKRAAKKSGPLSNPAALDGRVQSARAPDTSVPRGDVRTLVLAAVMIVGFDEVLAILQAEQARVRAILG